MLKSQKLPHTWQIKLEPASKKLSHQESQGHLDSKPDRTEMRSSTLGSNGARKKAVEVASLFRLNFVKMPDRLFILECV